MTDVHPFIKPAVSAAVAETLGTTVNEQGQLDVPPNVAAFYARYQQLEATVESLQETVVGYGTTITQQATTITQQADLITQLSSSVNSKANASTVSTLSQRVTTLSGTVDAKADAAAVSQQFQAVAGIDSGQATAIAAVQQALGSEDGIVQGLLTTVGQHTGLLGGLRTDVDLKAPSATVSSLSGRVTTLTNATNDSTSGLAATYALASTAKTATDTNAAGLVTANTAIGNRLRKDQADVTTYPLGVPVATGMDKAVQKSELVGGIQRPYRVFQNVSTAQVGAYVRSGQAAAVSDALGLGQVYVITLFRIKTITAPTIASNITLFSNGAQAYTATVALASLPAVGKTLDLLSLAANSLPADITLPATLTVTASAGVFEILIDGVLK